MRVAIFGGTGFVGGYLVDALVSAGVKPIVMVRPGSEHKMRHPERCQLVSGDISDNAAMLQMLDGADAVIYNIGILREFPKRGITFDQLHEKAAIRVIDAARWTGVNRFILMGANGAKADGTPYQMTKYRAEQYLMKTRLDWTVFSPSVIFGDPRGRMEFATQLLQDIIEPPIPAPLFYTGMLPGDADPIRLTPVHIDDVAQAFARALRDPGTYGKKLCLGGAAEVTWREILSTIADVVGKSKHKLPVPAFGVSTAARLLDRFESFPITHDQLQMLLEGNTCPTDDLISLGITPKAFGAHELTYLLKNRKLDAGLHERAA